MIENDNPILCLNAVLNQEKQFPLIIRTDLKNLPNDWVERYGKLFSWHLADSERSLLTSAINNPLYEFSYYDRIYKYFGVDQTNYTIINTWDPKVDLKSRDRKPCLILISFMQNGMNLDMSVVFRRRDIVKRMIPNWNALAKFQKNASEKRGLLMGRLSDISLDYFWEDKDFQKLKGMLL